MNNILCIKLYIKKEKIFKILKRAPNVQIGFYQKVVKTAFPTRSNKNKKQKTKYNKKKSKRRKCYTTQQQRRLENKKITTSNKWIKKECIKKSNLSILNFV